MPRPKKSSYPATKPPFSYISLCVMAIESSPIKMMTLSEIYRFVTEKFEYYRSGDNRWKNSLRHNLSFNECFIKRRREDETGRNIRGRKGNYWALHPGCKGMFRKGSTLRRKRRFRKGDLTENESLHNARSEMNGSTVSGANVPINLQYLKEEALEIPMKSRLSSAYYGGSYSSQVMADHPSNEEFRNKAPLQTKGSTPILRNIVASKRSGMEKNTFKGSAFTIENILKRDNDGKDPSQSIKKSYERQTYRDERKPLMTGTYSERFSTEHRAFQSVPRDRAGEMMFFKQPLSDCLYCRKEKWERKCQCEQCCRGYVKF